MVNLYLKKKEIKTETKRGAEMLLFFLKKLSLKIGQSLGQKIDQQNEFGFF
jgi:hypothetical protein